MRCSNCGWDNPDQNTKCEKCDAPLENELISKLKGLPREIPEFPPHENAMCYCQAPPDWHNPDDNNQGGNGKIHKVLIILAIIAAVAIVVAVAFV